MGREEAEQQQMVEEAAALLTARVNRLQQYPPDLRGEVAREYLMDLRPHLQAAIEALAYIARRRDLNDRERALQNAFKILLDARRLRG